MIKIRQWMSALLASASSTERPGQPPPSLGDWASYRVTPDDGGTAPVTLHVQLAESDLFQWSLWVGELGSVAHGTAVELWPGCYTVRTAGPDGSMAVFEWDAATGAFEKLTGTSRVPRSWWPIARDS